MTTKKNNIFIIDDEEIMLEALKDSLASQGYSVKCFKSAASALEELPKVQCDLIISDVNMPGMDGFDFLTSVKRSKPNLPMLLISGFADVPKAVKAMRLGAVDFIEKPVSEGTLFETVNLALRELPENTSDLTKVELKILRLVATGKSSKEISELLGRSVRTVDNHRHRMMKKLGITNASGLVSYAHANRLIA